MMTTITTSTQFNHRYDNHKYNNPKGIAPEKISFIQEVAYSITGRTKENVAYWFPSPYYKIQNNKAIAVWGNYVEQLFELKKNGILRACDILE